MSSGQLHGRSSARAYLEHRVGGSPAGALRSIYLRRVDAHQQPGRMRCYGRSFWSCRTDMWTWRRFAERTRLWAAARVPAVTLTRHQLSELLALDIKKTSELPPHTLSPTSCGFRVGFRAASRAIEVATTTSHVGESSGRSLHPCHRCLHSWIPGPLHVRQHRPSYIRGPSEVLNANIVYRFEVHIRSFQTKFLSVCLGAAI